MRMQNALLFLESGNQAFEYVKSSLKVLESENISLHILNIFKILIFIFIIILVMLKKCPLCQHYARCSDCSIMPKIMPA